MSMSFKGQRQNLIAQVKTAQEDHSTNIKVTKTSGSPTVPTSQVLKLPFGLGSSKNLIKLNAEPTKVITSEKKSSESDSLVESDLNERDQNPDQKEKSEIKIDSES